MASVPPAAATATPLALPGGTPLPTPPGLAARKAGLRIDTVTVGGATIATPTEKLNYCGDFAWYVNRYYPGFVTSWSYDIWNTQNCYMLVQNHWYDVFNEANLAAYSTMLFPAGAPYR